MRRWLSSLMAFDSGDPDYDRRARTLTAIVLVAIPGSFISALLTLPFPNGGISAVVLLIAATSLSGVIWLAHIGRLNLAVMLFAIGCWIVVVGQPVLTGDMSTNVMVVPLSAVMLVYVIPPRRMWWLLPWALSALLVLQLGTNDVDTVEQPRIAWTIQIAVITAVTVAVVLYGAVQLTRSVRSQQRLAAELTAREATMRRLEEMANTDPLTGFLNRRSLESSFERVPPGSAVALIDIDHFKRVNDELSHAVGDRVLADFSALVADAAQSDDLLYRLGGDEFLVLRRHSTAAALGGWLHDVRIRARGHLQLDPSGEATVAFSCGVVAVTGEELSQTLERVDKALYAAKEAGRDTIVVFD